MRRIFIGDLHLQESRPDITEGFIRFLREECLRCDELYILGDLFEAWIGDDERADLSERVAWELQRLRRPGKYFIRGNRDFLIGKDFCSLAGLTLLPDISEVRLGRSSAVILHGDLLCTADKKYQKYRRTVSNHFLQKCFLALPLAIRKRIAAGMRSKSRSENAVKPQDLMEVSDSEVIKIMTARQCSVMIHGHTHRPLIKDYNTEIFQANSLYLPARRYVVGAWDREFKYVRADGDEVKLITARLDGRYSL